MAATALLAASIPFASAAQPAAAANSHSVTLSGTIEVYECCGFLSDSDTQRRDFEVSFLLNHAGAGQRTVLKASVCAGGEARGELRVGVNLQGSEVLVTRPTLRLFEGSDCDNFDLDDQHIGEVRNLPLGTAQTWVLFAANTEFHSSDTATAWFSVIHKTGPGG
ncbi:hypothetical protein ACFW20_34320 [Streptomyces nigra]|uniref:hypothetical protein n=1 Tax=Streptomyces nigra TaxID=1827580 RepID=UPI0036C2BC5C